MAGDTEDEIEAFLEAEGPDEERELSPEMARRVVERQRRFANLLALQRVEGSSSGSAAVQLVVSGTPVRTQITGPQAVHSSQSRDEIAAGLCDGLPPPTQEPESTAAEGGWAPSETSGCYQ